jgi:hypothetical protein
MLPDPQQFLKRETDGEKTAFQTTTASRLAAFHIFTERKKLVR